MPFADVGPLKIESDLTDEQVLFLSDILPTGYMGAEMCDIQPSDVVAVWGAGPVGQFAMDSARVLGAAKVIAIDKEPYRLQMAERAGHTPVNFEEVDVRSRGRLPARPTAAVARWWSGPSPASWRQLAGVVPVNQTAEYEAARLSCTSRSMWISLRRLPSLEPSRDCRPGMAGPAVQPRGMGHSLVPR